MKRDDSKTLHLCIDLLVADRLWYARHTGTTVAFNGLNEQVYQDRAELKAAILAQAQRFVSSCSCIEYASKLDSRWIDFVSSLSPAQLLEGFSYSDTHGKPWVRERGPALDHLFNQCVCHLSISNFMLVSLLIFPVSYFHSLHSGTHHRGQISAALSQLGIAESSYPAMDLLYFDPMKPPQ